MRRPRCHRRSRQVENVTQPLPPQDRTIAAIVTALAPAFPVIDAATQQGLLADVSGFVASQVAALPDFLRAPYRLALVGFEWLPALRWGRRFTALDEAPQQRYVARWSASRLGVMRNFVKLIRSCARLAYYDHPALHDALRAQAARRT
jgi:hypothetical protein